MPPTPHRRSRFAIALLAFSCAAVLLVVAWVYHGGGYASGGACDWGFGERQRAVFEKSLRELFPEPLPPVLHGPTISCHVWTDLSLKASFSITQDEGRALVAALEQTYLTPQNHPVVADAVKHRMLIGPPTHSTYVYELPGFGPIEHRIVRVTLPVNTELAATVELDGGTF